MAHRTTIKNPKLAKRVSLEEAKTVFLNNCRIVIRTLEMYDNTLQ